AAGVGVEVGVAAGEAEGVFGGPAPGVWVVVAGAEADEAGVGVVVPASEAEGLQAGRGVGEDATPSVEVEALDDLAGGGVDDEADAAEVVLDEAEGLAAADHVLGREAAGVHELGEVAGGVDLGDGAEAVEVEPAVGQDAVDALANAAIEAVDDVVDGGGAVQGDAEQVAEFARVMTAAGFLDCEPFRLPARRPTHRRIGYR